MVRRHFLLVLCQLRCTTTRLLTNPCPPKKRKKFRANFTYLRRLAKLSSP